MYRNLFLGLAVVLGASIVACQPEDPSEKAVDHLEEAGEEMKAAGEDLANKARETGENMANEVEDACEEVKEGAGAADTDC